MPVYAIQVVEQSGRRVAKYTPHLPSVPNVSQRQDLDSSYVDVEDSTAYELSKLGIPFISRVMFDYAMDRVYKPFRHQRFAVNAACVFPRMFFLMDMRTGKTPSALWSMDYLMGRGSVTRCLIVTTKSIMEDTWGREITNLIPYRKFTILHGEAAKRRKLADEHTPVHIINFDGVDIIQKELIANNYDMVIVDECRNYMNESTQRWKALVKIVKPRTRVIALTGAPCSTSLMDCYGQVKLVLPESCRNIPQDDGRSVIS